IVPFPELHLLSAKSHGLTRRKVAALRFFDLNFSEDHNWGLGFRKPVGVAMSIETLPARHRPQFPSGKLGGNRTGSGFRRACVSIDMAPLARFRKYEKEVSDPLG